MHIFKALLEPSQTSNEISQLEEEKAESSPQKDSKPSLLQCHSLPLSNPHQKLEKTSQNSHNSIHSIIQARKISIPPTNNLFQSSLSNATTPNSLHNLPDYNHLMTLKPPNIESTYKKPLKPSDTEVLDNITVKKPSQKYQRKISINVLESNYTKKTPPLSKESLNKNNIPTEKVQTKTFNFVNTIFNPTNSPNRTILFSEYLVERLGEARFNRMKSYLETHSNPLKVLEEERGMIGEVIGEENLDCIKIFKYLISNVVTPSKGETMIKMKEESRSRGEMFKKKVKEEG